jgi:hypothetical protein
MGGTRARLALLTFTLSLANKLADCGVLGVSSFEYLNFAVRYRDEWISKGKEIVQEMKRTATSMFAHGDVSVDFLEL